MSSIESDTLATLPPAPVAAPDAVAVEVVRMLLGAPTHAELATAVAAILRKHFGPSASIEPLWKRVSSEMRRNPNEP